MVVEGYRANSSCPQIKSPHFINQRKKLNNIDSKQLNGKLSESHNKGTIAEMKTALYYMEQGYTVYWPLCGASAADLVAVKGDEVIRIQVKTPQSVNKGYKARYLQIATSRGIKRDIPYTKKDCDVIFAVYGDEMWCIPIEEIKDSRTVYLGPELALTNNNSQHLSSKLKKEIN